MSSESGGGNKESSRTGEESTTGESAHGKQLSTPSSAPLQSTPSTSEATDEPKREYASESTAESLERKPAARPSQQGEGTAESSSVAPSEVSPSSAPDVSESPRQVIAVSANRGPTAFFNLAKRFLITDEICDLSALEGAIVSAVDAAHLLERSKLATIVRVQTSYVTVEPKRKKRATPSVEGGSGIDPHQQQSIASASHVAHGATATAASYPQTHYQAQEGRPPSRQRREGKRGERELKRARIVITVRRTPAYKQWLDENPLQAVIAGDGDDESPPSVVEGGPTDTQAEPSDSSKPT